MADVVPVFGSGVSAPPANGRMDIELVDGAGALGIRLCAACTRESLSLSHVGSTNGWQAWWPFIIILSIHIVYTHNIHDPGVHNRSYPS